VNVFSLHPTVDTDWLRLSFVNVQRRPSCLSDFRHCAASSRQRECHRGIWWVGWLRGAARSTLWQLPFQYSRGGPSPSTRNERIDPRRRTRFGRYDNHHKFAPWPDPLRLTDLLQFRLQSKVIPLKIEVPISNEEFESW